MQKSSIFCKFILIVWFSISKKKKMHNENALNRVMYIHLSLFSNIHFSSQVCNKRHECQWQLDEIEMDDIDTFEFEW